MSFVAVFILLCHTNQIPICDVGYVELNHCYDYKGRLQYDQVICWDNSSCHEYNYSKVVGYKLVTNLGRRNCTSQEIKEIKEQWEEADVKIPESYRYSKWRGFPIFRQNKYYLYILPTTHGLIFIRATGHFESWTQYDPEMEHRKLLPRELRRCHGELYSPH